MNASRILAIATLSMWVSATSCTYQKAKKREAAAITQNEGRLAESQAGLRSLEKNRAALQRRRAQSQGRIRRWESQLANIRKESSLTQQDIQTANNLVRLLDTEKKILGQTESQLARGTGSGRD